MSSSLARSLGLLAITVAATTSSTGHADRLKLDYRVGPPSGIKPADLGGSIIYLNRCVGGCTIHPGQDDSEHDVSLIPSEVSSFPEYTGFAAGEWEAVVKCVQDVYSPYNVKVVDQRPVAGSTYSMIYVGGSGAAVQYNMPGVGGVAFVASDCSPFSAKGVAYAFTDQIDVFAGEDGGNRVNGLCWIIAQETAHTYGLDHEYSYLDDDSSACNDPMTYRSDCGGEKFFRNRDAKCGEFGSPRPNCGPSPDGLSGQCGFTQNSHSKMLSLFGAGTPTTTAPVVTMVGPAPMSTVIAGSAIIAKAKSQRGIARLELWINGFKWGNPVKGAAFGAQGQGENPYQLSVPAGIPDSILDIVVKAYDDINVEGKSTMLTVTKGAAGGCVDESSCAKGQHCGMGRCFWDPPTGAFGDACTFNEGCVSNLCSQTADHQVCTHPCTVGVSDACEMTYECLATSGTNGFCYPIQEDVGCCSVGHTSSTESTVAKFALALGALGLVLRRRKRTRTA